MQQKSRLAASVEDGNRASVLRASNVGVRSQHDREEADDLVGKAVLIEGLVICGDLGDENAEIQLRDEKGIPAVSSKALRLFEQTVRPEDDRLPRKILHRADVGLCDLRRDQSCHGGEEYIYGGGLDIAGFTRRNHDNADVLTTAAERKDPDLSKLIEVVAGEQGPTGLEIVTLYRGHAIVNAALRKGPGEKMSGRRVETDGYPGEVARTLGYRQQEGSGANAQMAAKNTEGAGGGEAASRFGKIVVDGVEDVLRFRLLVGQAARRQE